MNLTRLTLKDISGNAFRSWIIVTCAFLVAGFALATVLIARGVDDSLGLTQRRLGADLVIVPKGTERTGEGALLTGSLVKVRIPASHAQEISTVPGVAAASPQLYMGSVSNSPYCSAPKMFVVAYDPATDFTIQPWLATKTGTGLKLGEAVGGTFVFVPPGEKNILLYGCGVTLKANLEPTGSNLDQSVFVTFETVSDMARRSDAQTAQTLMIPGDGVSSVMVKVAAGFDAKRVAAQIQNSVPGVSVVNSPDLFGSFRVQISGQRTGMLAILGAVLALSLIVIAVVFSMAVNEHRREIGVLRALGATRARVLRLLLTGAAVLALAGGLAGIVCSGLILYLFRHKLTSSFGFPFLFPSPANLVLLVVIGLAVALGGVLVAAFIPAYRISRQDPAISMRE